MDNQAIQPTPPPPSSNHSSKTFLLILGAIALMAISAMGGYYLGANKQLQPSQLSIQPSQTFPTPTTTPTPMSDETADWKTYTNTKYGFEVKYPQDLSIRESKDDPRPSLSILFEKGANPPSYWVELSVFLVGNNQNLRQWANDDSRYLKPAFSNKSVAIFPYNQNGLEGFTANGGQQFTNKYVWIKNKNNIIEFILGDGDPNGDYRNNKEAQTTFDQILSTFKFTK